MLHPALQAVYRAVTGTPYYTTRIASAEFGPSPAAIHRAQLAKLTDERANAAWEELKLAHRVRDQFERFGKWPDGWSAERLVDALAGEARVREWLYSRRTKVGVGQ